MRRYTNVDDALPPIGVTVEVVLRGNRRLLAHRNWTRSNDIGWYTSDKGYSIYPLRWRYRAKDMLIAQHKRCGKTHTIDLVLENKEFWIKGLCNGVEVWFGKEAYYFSKWYDVTKQQINIYKQMNGIEDENS